MSTLNSSRTGQGIVHLSRTFFKNYALLRRGSPDTILRCNVSNKVRAHDKANMDYSWWMCHVEFLQHYQKEHGRLQINQRVSAQCYARQHPCCTPYRVENIHANSIQKWSDQKEHAMVLEWRSYDDVLQESIWESSHLPAAVDQGLPRSIRSQNAGYRIHLH